MKFVFFLTLMLGLQAGAFQVGMLEKADEDFKYNDYYKVTQQIEASQINLLNFEHTNKTFPLPTVPYNRDKHFGGWINFKNDDSCLNTRGLVLKRDSSREVTVNSNCTVTGGDWYDPYTDKNYQSATQVQIDHVVALKNAYMTGAFEWEQNKRCLYANYMGNNFHLLAVDGPENMKKGDKSPREYIPPNEGFTCQYLQTWLKIKYIWQLRLTPKELERIQTVIHDEKCDARDFVVQKSEMDQQRKFINDNINLCSGAVLSSF